MAAASITSGTSTLPSPTVGGGTNSSTLSEYAGPYVTSMLGKAQASAAEPYQTYQGPLTAGPSALQTKMFQGLGNLAFPSNLGQSFSSTGSYQVPQYDAAGATPGAVTAGSGTNIASNYMNPYLQNVLTPQLDELRRQYDISGNQLNAKAASQGAFGGSRNALQSAENDRNMMQEMNKTIGTGYANAYDKAMNQFNVEQGQSRTLADMIATQGGTQQGLEQQGVTADYNEFVNQRDYPQTQLKFLQSMLQGLPISTVYNTPLGQTTGQQAVGNVTDATALLQTLGVIPRTPAAT